MEPSLSSPIPTKEFPISTLASIPLADIEVRDDFNPRDNAVKAQIESLTKSIGHRGLLQPLVVTPNDSGYYLVDGHRRFLACRELGFVDVPVTIREVSDEVEQLIDAVTANVQREDLSIVEEAKAFARMREQGKPVKQIASELGVSQKLVSARLALLSLPPAVLIQLEKGELQPGHVPALVDLAKLSPQLAGEVARITAPLAIAPAQFAANPLARITSGYGPVSGVWVIGHQGVVEIASVKADLAEIDLARLKEIGELSACSPPHAIAIDVDGGVEFGAVYATPAQDDQWNVKYATTDRNWVVDAVQQAIVALVEKRRKNPVTSAVAPATTTNDPPLSEEKQKEANREARKAEFAERLKAHSLNLNLGAELFTELAEVSLRKDVALAMTRLVLGAEARSVYLAGMRFCDPKVASEVPGKDGKLGKIVYDVPDREKQDLCLIEFIERGETGEQVLGRLLQVLAMAALCDQTSVAPSSRPGRPIVASRETDFLASLLGSRLPVPIRERLDAQAAAAAARQKAQADEDAAYDTAHDESMKLVLACDDPASQREMALDHIDEFGDPDGLLDHIVADVEEED